MDCPLFKSYQEVFYINGVNKRDSEDYVGEYSLADKCQYLMRPADGDARVSTY